MLEEAVDYGVLEQSIRSTTIKNGLEDVNGKLRMLQIIRHKFIFRQIRIRDEGNSTLRDNGSKTWLDAGRTNRFRKNEGIFVSLKILL